MVMQTIPKKRCAIYTRKSVEEGLDQEFNSLDAQRIRNSTVWMLNGRLAKPISPVRKPTDGSASRLVMTMEDIPAAI